VNQACEQLLSGAYKPTANVASSKKAEDDELERALKASMMPQE